MNSRIFEQIVLNVRKSITHPEIITSLKTMDGQTQHAERTNIKLIENVLIEMKLKYSKAGSQQPYDFRICLPGHESFTPKEEDIREHHLEHDGEIGMLLLEVKKTDSKSIYFNDTCPSINVHYIMFTTGKIYKQKAHENKLPCIYAINGNEIIEASPWLAEFKLDLEMIKKKYKTTEGYMSVYPRPTYKADMSVIFNKYYEESKIECSILSPKP